jgi:gamma-glutamyl hercynylcysteine S-oxide hydrolase
MCRHLAYLGPPRSLEQVVLSPPHSLVRQSYAPRDMRGGGTLNADGYGLGWYPGDADRPVRHRRTGPIWADHGLAALARHTTTTAALAAVRSATVGMPVVETAAAPFADGPWLFSHNGVLPGWPGTAEPLASVLPVRDLMTLDAPTDSALLWARVRAALREGQQPADAVSAVVEEAAALVPGARLNLLLHDGAQIVATAWYHALSVLAGDDFVVLSSEPYDDDPRWSPVPDRHLVVAALHGGVPRVQIRQLEEKAVMPAHTENGAP